MMTNESMKPDFSTVELVMKICLIISVIIGSLLILLTLLFNRNILDVGGSVVPIIALQWFFYLRVRARKRSELNGVE